MIETYVSIGKVTDYAIGVLKYFATASSILLISIIGALGAWMFWSAVGMIVAIIGIVVQLWPWIRTRSRIFSEKRLCD